MLYGTSTKGGYVGSGCSGGCGTVFAINTNGTGFTTLHSFNYDDGRGPRGELVLTGNTLYGITPGGGGPRNGTLFAINTGGTGFTNLHHFTEEFPSSGSFTNSDGVGPSGGLFLSGNTLYGTATYGGNSGNGTVFSFSLGSVSVPAPKLVILASGANAVLTWLTNASGFTLRATTNIANSNSWVAITNAPTINGSNYSLTLPATNAARFFRLRSP
jgi:uncharacterized repeat protein (TIGR03803 family)